MENPITVDFETHPIFPRPNYPPRPVSVAIWDNLEKNPEFWAWGHPSQNNCSFEQARERLRDVWKSPRGILCHEAGFDLDVAESHFGLPFPPWHKIHDTIFLLFLADPNSESIALKPSAERYLSWPQEDQEALQKHFKEAIDAEVRRVRERGLRLKEGLPVWMQEVRRSPRKWEKWICKLPGDLGADRAIGDVRRTRALFEAFYARSEAYDRERRLLPVRIQMERRGVPVDTKGLESDLVSGEKSIERIDSWLRERLDDPALDVQKRGQLAEALEKARYGEEWLIDEWILTKSGAPALNHEDLRAVCKDRAIVDVLRLRNILKTQVSTFVVPWLNQARETNGRFHVHFNQVRATSARRGRQLGARTGRLSSDPNLMNVPEAQPLLADTPEAYEEACKISEALLVPVPGTKLLDLRARIRAPAGFLLGANDYSQQEMRLLAHFAKSRSPLMRAYLADPRTDAHSFVRSLVVPRLGREISHRNIKAVNFGVLFGEGIRLLAHKLECGNEEASAIRNACKRATGAGDLDREIQAAQKVVTLGGRECPVEPPSIINGRVQNWGYKLLNTLIQGSAGDQLKEAMIRVDEAHSGCLLLSVHDELVWEAHENFAPRLVESISKIMSEAFRLRVPVIADGTTGFTWRDCK